MLQRVKRASVKNNNIHHSIKQGYCLLVGFGKSSTEQDIETLAKKIVNARLFEDDAGKLNLNLQQVEGEILSISQLPYSPMLKRKSSWLFKLDASG